MTPPNQIGSFESAALPHLDSLYRTATRILGDRTAAEDCVQETYLQACRCFDRFTLGTNCRAWLYKILFHVIRHHRRKRFRFWQSATDPEILSETVPAPAPAAEGLTDPEILQALDEIPERFREVLLLCDVQEFAYREAADILDVPIGTVMSRLSRARALLREKLAGIRTPRGYNLARAV